MTKYETKFIIERCKTGLQTISVEGYPIIVHPTLTLEKSRELVSNYCLAFIEKCAQEYTVLDIQRIWKLSVICAYTDVFIGEEPDTEMLNELVYGTPIFDMLVGENGYEPAINMKQYRDLVAAVENTLRFWAICIENKLQNDGCQENTGK